MMGQNYAKHMGLTLPSAARSSLNTDFNSSFNSCITETSRLHPAQCFSCSKWQKKKVGWWTAFPPLFSTSVTSCVCVWGLPVSLEILRGAR